MMQCNQGLANGDRPESSSPKVSFLCITRNRRDLAIRCLESCAAQQYAPCEIVVVDNDSTDGTYEAIRERFPGAKLLRTHRNIGFFPALNIAIANSSGDLLMTVDDDAFFQDNDAIEKMVNAFSVDPELGGVTCNIEGPFELPLVDSDRDVSGFKTGFAMLPRKVFTDWVGYYPDVFFRSAGEQYVCVALWDQGKRFRKLADVVMYHDQAMQGRSTWDWAYYGLRSQILVSFMRDPWYLIPPRLTHKLVKGFVHAVKKKDLRPWLAGWATVWFYVPSAWAIRKPISWKTQRQLWRIRSS